MALFSKQELKALWADQRSQFAYKSSDTVLREQYKEFDPDKQYTIFLSHSFKDKDSIVGLKLFLESLGYIVYVDWIEDVQLDRAQITKETAKLLKNRMINCQCLFFVTSDNSPSSVWMPWELGYFDGFKNRVAILPIMEETNRTNEYKGQEYLGVYPYVTKDTDIRGIMRLWITRSSLEYVSFSAWLKGNEPYKH